VPWYTDGAATCFVLKPRHPRLFLIAVCGAKALRVWDDEAELSSGLKYATRSVDLGLFRILHLSRGPSALLGWRI
jgi:hypothetical protein